MSVSLASRISERTPESRTVLACKAQLGMVHGTAQLISSLYTERRGMTLLDNELMHCVDAFCSGESGT